MKCDKCHNKYREYGIVETSISLFCRICFETIWLSIPNYISRQQREPFADKLFNKYIFPPQHLNEVYQ